MTATSAATRFQIRFTGLNKAMVVLGLHPGNSHVAIDDGQVEVRMGWAFRVRFPASTVSAIVEDHSAVWGWGVHGWRGEWLVNGSSAGIVRIELSAPVRGRLLGIPVNVRTLRVAVQEPAALVSALG